MPFLARGIEHRSSPLAIRECVAMDAGAAASAAVRLAAIASIDEVVILSTCNRTEVYLSTDDPSAAAEAVEAYLASLDGRVGQYLRTWNDMEAAEHLFRVACGLESQVLGEAQILSQVREALDIAQSAGTVGPNLHSLFRSAISCARQARAGTALGRVNLSAGSRAVDVAREALGTLGGRSALVVGGGEISKAIAEHLRREDVGALFIANRTLAVAVDLARRLDGTPVPLGEIARVLPRVDVIFSATSAPHFVLTLEDVPAGGRDVPLHVFDLAIPRDVDPAVGTLPGIVLYDLDSLISSDMTEQWEGDIRQIEGIVAAEVKEFEAWYLTRRVVPVISSLRRHVEAVSEAELKRVAPQLAGLTPRERAAVESLTGRLIDKMFHHLVTRLRLAAQSDPKLVEAAEFFFLHGEGGLFEHAADLERKQSHTPERTQ